MPLRRDPLHELLDLQERMNRLFDETLTRERLEEPALLHGTWTPLADVVETSEAYLVELELPGLCRDDVMIQAQGDELVVRGERRPAGAASCHDPRPGGAGRLGEASRRPSRTRAAAPARGPRP